MMMKQDIKAVLFDMDGLLIDSERVGIDVLIKESLALGTPVTADFLRSVLGLTRDMTRERYHAVFPEVDFDCLDDRYSVKMMQLAERGLIPPKKGAAELLKALHSHGVPRCVASSSPRKNIISYLKALGLYDDAPVCVSSEEAAHSKPWPDVFLKAAECVGTDIRECLILEDSPNGLAAARRSGAVVGMVPDLIPFSADLAPLTDHVFADLDEVREWLGL